MDYHKDYIRHSEEWRKCRAAREGETAVKAAREQYLPRLSGQDNEAYKDYLSRALWYGATGRTVEAMIGMLFSRPADYTVPDALDWILDDIDGAGAPVEELAETIADEIITTGRCGIFIDYPELPAGATRADEEALGAQPYAIVFKAEDIIDWTYGVLGHKRYLKRVVLFSGVSADGSNRYKVLEMVGRAYTIREVDEEGKALGAVRVPELGGSPLGHIPFRFVNPDRGQGPVQPSPIRGLVAVNFSHYRTMADLEHGRFYCGVPTPIFAGFQFEEGEGVNLGMKEGLVTSDASAKAYYMEFTGEGLGALERAAEQKENMMAKLGSRLLAEDKAASETAEAMRLRSSGEHAVLSSISASVSAAILGTLEEMVVWLGGDPKAVFFTLATDFEVRVMNFQELDALTKALQSGAIGRRLYYHQLQEGKRLPSGYEYEDYLEDTPGAGVAGEGV